MFLYAKDSSKGGEEFPHSCNPERFRLLGQRQEALEQMVFKKEIDFATYKDKYGELWYDGTQGIKVGYWRKAFLVHAWLEERYDIQNCEEVEIERESLRELLDTCKQVRDDPKTAPEWLDYYDEDCVRIVNEMNVTIEILETYFGDSKLVALPVFYLASW